VLPFLVVIAALLQGVPGQRYTLRMTTDHGERVVATVREDGRSARIDFESRRSGGEGYIIVQGGQVVVVHPDKRRYSVLDDSTFVRIVGVGLQAASDVGVVRFRVRDAQFTPQRLGRSDSIAGFATQHLRLTERFTVDVSAFGMRGEAVRTRVVTDYWVTEEPRLLPNPLIEMLSRLGTVLGQSDAIFARREAAARRALVTGTPLKIVVTTWSRDRDEPDGRSEVQTIEIGDLIATTVDPAIFRIPQGFERLDGDFSWRF
jgi:hypothetical protein